MRILPSRKSRFRDRMQARAAAANAPRPMAVEPVHTEIPHGVTVAGEMAWRFIAIAIAMAMIAWGLAQLSSVVLPVAVALLFTALGQPLVDLLNNKLKLNRYLAAILTILLGIGLVAALFAVAGGQLVSGFSALSEQVRAGVEQIQNWLITGPLQIGGAELSQLLDQAQTWLGNNAGSLTSGAIAAGSTATNFVAGLLIAIVVSVFLMGDGASIWGWLVRLLPRNIRDSAHNAGRRGWTTVGAYVRTQILVAGIDAVGIGLGAFILGVPLAVPLALIVFLASFIPMVGAIASGALAVIVALVSQGFVTALWMLLVVLLVQQLEGNVLQPLLMSRSVSLHPLATLLGVAVGSYLIGIAGAVFAVPLMAFVNVVVLYLRGHDKFPELGEEPYPRANYELAEEAEELPGVAGETIESDPHRDPTVGATEVTSAETKVEVPVKPPESSSGSGSDDTKSR